VPKLKPEELESRRKEIIDAARTCFLRNGFHRTTTDEICREASITPGGLYHYFGGKDEIIAAVIEDTANEMVGRFRAVIDSTGDIRQAFADISSLFIDTMHDPNLDNLVRLDLEIWAEGLKNAKLYEISKRSWGMRRQLMELFVKRGAEGGIYNMPNVDARGLSSLLVATLLGMRIGKVLLKDDFDLNGAIAAMFLVHGGRLITELPDLNGIMAPVIGETSAPAAARRAS
jgi:AcrR family transcriptional regulator